MTWFAQIISLTPTTRGFEVGVVLSDNISQKFVEQFQTDDTLLTLRNIVRARTVVADEIHSKPEFSVGTVLDLSVDVPPPPDPPSDADVARAAFLTAYHLLRAMGRGLQVGLIQGDDADLAAQTALVKKLFDVSYVNLL